MRGVGVGGRGGEGRRRGEEVGGGKGGGTDETMLIAA